MNALPARRTTRIAAAEQTSATGDPDLASARRALAILSPPASFVLAAETLRAAREHRASIAQRHREACAEDAARGATKPSSTALALGAALADADREVMAARQRLDAQRAEFQPRWDAAVLPHRRAAGARLAAALDEAEAAVAVLRAINSEAARLGLAHDPIAPPDLGGLRALARRWAGRR